MENISLPIALHIFLINDKNEILLMKRANTGYFDDFWSVPAGRLNGGESATAGTIREAQEEVGVLVNEADFSKPLVMHHKNEKGERIYFFFLTRKWKNDPVNMEPDKCAQIEWFPLDNLPKDIIDHVKFAIYKILDNATYIEFGF